MLRLPILLLGITLAAILVTLVLIFGVGSATLGGTPAEAPPRQAAVHLTPSSPQLSVPAEPTPRLAPVAREASPEEGKDAAATQALPAGRWKQYERADIDELKIEADRLRAQLSDAKTPLLLEKLNDGRSEFIGAEFEYKGRSSDQTEVFAIHYVPERGTYRTVLTRSEHPELYELKEQIEAIDGLIAAKSRIAHATAGGSAKKR